jgi:hypothetical protein
MNNLGARWGGWLTPRPGRFTPGNKPGPHPTAGCVGPWVEPRTVQLVARGCTTTLSAVVMVVGGEETPKMPQVEEV